MKGLSAKEIEIVSWLELENKRFFTKSDIRRFFRNKNEMNVYVHKLKVKDRIIRINKDKYYLVPIKAYKNKWSEHPFILVDEIFNEEDYFIGGNYAKYFWGFIEQIPREIDVYSTKKQGSMNIFNIKINFRRTTKNNLKNTVTKKIGEHTFLIASKNKTKKWLK